MNIYHWLLHFCSYKKASLFVAFLTFLSISQVEAHETAVFSEDGKIAKLKWDNCLLQQGGTTVRDCTATLSIESNSRTRLPSHIKSFALRFLAEESEEYQACFEILDVNQNPGNQSCLSQQRTEFLEQNPNLLVSVLFLSIAAKDWNRPANIDSKQEPWFEFASFSAEFVNDNNVLMIKPSLGSSFITIDLDQSKDLKQAWLYNYYKAAYDMPGYPYTPPISLNLEANSLLHLSLSIMAGAIGYSLTNFGSAGTLYSIPAYLTASAIDNFINSKAEQSYQLHMRLREKSETLKEALVLNDYQKLIMLAE